jgi:SAM-dependent methyltransferase
MSVVSEPRVPEAAPQTTDCPSCGSHALKAFYSVDSVPVNSCVLMRTAEEALTYPRGRVDMVFCEDCGFIFNRAFDLQLIEYSERYEETQGFSPTFNRFHEALAKQVIERYGLNGKKVVEIGCGKGEFITMVCELGENEGVGFDPSYVPDRSRAAPSERVRFVTDFYSERYAGEDADFVCCKMTLEHIPRVEAFMRTVRRAAGGRPDTVVFFQVPEIGIILRQRGFWDIYYEHCSYFSPESLADLFQRTGFEVRDVWTGYGDQYLMIEAVPAPAAQAMETAGRADFVATLAAEVDSFAGAVESIIDGWRKKLRGAAMRGERSVLWGSGSKAVSFLTTVGITTEVEIVVDINPHRQGMFMPGTGHRIVGPEALRDYRPDNVIVMNPVYEREIAEQLHGMGLKPRIESL